MAEIWTLTSDRLSIDVVKPGSELYGRTRFNWNCFINRITLDGRVQFAEPEQRDPERVTSYGAGICSEYQHYEAPETAAVGEEYPRLGNGYLVKQDYPYNFMVNEPCRPFPTVWDVKKDSITFTTDVGLCQGFAAREVKTVKVEGNTISVHTSLTNLGKRPITAQEYNHNFLSLNGEAVSPDYTMHVPGFANLEDGKFLGDNLYGNDEASTLKLHRLPETAYMTFMDEVKPNFAQCAPYSYRMTSANSNVAVSEKDDFIPARAVVWGVEHTMCFECFVQVDVKPGQTQEWTRTWTFEG